MNQDAFQRAHESEWSQFERWLEAPSSTQRTSTVDEPLSEDSIAHRYRVVCQHLALARDRQYSPGLVEMLNTLVVRGHQRLYGAHPEAGPAVARFFAADFARSVRAQWRAIAVAAALFFIPLIAVTLAIQRYPDFIHIVLPQKQILDYEQMYDPANRGKDTREAAADAMMLGHYIWNNIRIGFQIFAGGLLFGLGSVFFLAANGLFIGAAAGHLLRIGFGTPFFSFIAGHSAFELTGIVLMGAAGLMLGQALLLPGPLTRIAALQARSKAAVPLVYGGGALLTLAALVEAFWSPLTAFPASAKYALGTSLWVLLLGYFLLAGRTRAD